MCLFSIDLSLMKNLFKSFAHLKKLGCLSFCYWVVKVFIIDWSPLTNMWSTISFSPPVACFLIYLTVFFEEQKFSNLILIFLLLFVSYLREIYLPKEQRFSLSCTSFIVLAFMFKSMIYLHDLKFFTHVR